MAQLQNETVTKGHVGGSGRHVDHHIAVLCAAVALDEVQANDETALAYHREIVATMKELSQTSHSYQEHFDQVVKFYDIEKSSRLADLVSGLSLANRDDLQALLQGQIMYTFFPGGLCPPRTPPSSMGEGGS